MNLDFTRYQRLPEIDVQALAAIVLKAGDRGCSRGIPASRPPLVSPRSPGSSGHESAPSQEGQPREAVLPTSSSR